MSSRDERRRAAGKLPPANRVPQPLSDRDFVPVLEYQVGSWCPTPDGSGPATAVALRLHGPVLNGGEAQTVTMHLRLKSARAVDELIAALERHRNDVWPGG